MFHPLVETTSTGERCCCMIRRQPVPGVWDRPFPLNSNSGPVSEVLDRLILLDSNKADPSQLSRTSSDPFQDGGADRPRGIHGHKFR